MNCCFCGQPSQMIVKHKSNKNVMFVFCWQCWGAKRAEINGFCNAFGV